MDKLTLKNKKVVYGIWVAIALVYAGLAFAVFYKFAGMNNSDTFAHAVGIVDIWIPNGFAEYFNRLSYPGWHVVTRFFMLFGLSLAQAAGASSAVFAFLTAVIVFYVCSMIFGWESDKRIWLAAGTGIILLFVTALYVPWYTDRIYYGQGSPTIWHSPTYLAVKPFALLSCLLLFQMIRKREAKAKTCVVYALLTLVCLFMKPSFFQVQAPAVFVYLVLDLIMYRDWRFVRNVALTFIPAILYMLLQFWIMFYSSTGGGEGISLCFFDVYKFTCRSLPVSVLLLLAFPLYATGVLWKDIFRKGSPYLFLGFMLVAGFCEYSFLMENGPRMMHGNFSWGYMLSVFLYWAFVLPLFFKRSFVVKDIAWPLAIIGCVLVAWHFGSGIIYYLQLLLDPTNTLLF